ncbi:MAG TPA: RNA polymerase sigma factor [Myxococcaceae bacterium]|nr:RNA polymerase sigma factor [Myxococcaceae bacterium]
MHPAPLPPAADDADRDATAPGADVDEALMERFCNGDEGAFNALYQRHAGALRGFLLRWSHSQATADDLLQLTFISAVRGRGRWEKGRPVKPWLYAIAANAARDWSRRQGRSETLTDDGALPVTPVNGAAQAMDHGLSRAVQTALAQLPEGQRLPILMHRFEGLGFAEIAEVMGLSETAVKVRAHRGYVRLRELLSGLKEELDA